SPDTANFTYPTTASGNLVVSKATATGAVGNVTATYDTTPHPVTSVTTNPASLSYTVSYSGSSYGPTPTAPTDAGSYTATVTITDNNYQGSGTGSVTIAKA